MLPTILALDVVRHNKVPIVQVEYNRCKVGSATRLHEVLLDDVAIRNTPHGAIPAITVNHDTSIGSLANEVAANNVAITIWTQSDAISILFARVADKARTGFTCIDEQRRILASG